MRAPFQNFIHWHYCNTGSFDYRRRATGGHQFETELVQLAGHLHGARLIHFPHRNKRCTSARNTLAGTQRRLTISLCKGSANTHDFTGRLHFRAEDWIHLLKLGKREDGFFDVEIGRHDFPGKVLLRQTFASHATGSDLGQRHTDALGHKGYSTRCAWINLQHVDLTILHCKLHIHQTDYTKLACHGGRLLTHDVLQLFIQRIWRQ